MKCPSCNATIPHDSEFCPACFTPVETGVATARPDHRAGEKNTSVQTPIQTPRPVRDLAVNKTLLLGIGFGGALIVILVIVVAIIFGRLPVPSPGGGQPPVKMTEAQEKAPEPEPKTEEAQPAKPTAPEVKDPVKNTVRGTVKRAVKQPQYQPQSTPTSPGGYTTVEVPVPSPKPQSKTKSGIEQWLDNTLGPEKPVTHPPPAGDARNGM